MKDLKPLVVAAGLAGASLCCAGEAPRGRALAALDHSAAGHLGDGGFRVEINPASLLSFPSPPGISSLVRIVVAGDSADMNARFAAAETLGNDLQRDDIATLYAFLRTPLASGQKNLPGLYALQNEVLNVLRDQTVVPQAFTDTLISVYHDAALDSVTRDYSIQHLATWYEQGAPDAPEAPRKILQVLQEATFEKASIAGTALLALHLLAAEDDTLQSEIDRAALRLACGERTEVAARITAIQVCAERRLREALPVIEKLAQSAACTPLRLSALAALRQFGASPPTRITAHPDHRGCPPEFYQMVNARFEAQNDTPQTI